MLSLGQAEAERAVLRGDLENVPVAERRVWLLSIIADGKDSSNELAQVRRAFALIYFVQLGLCTSNDEGFKALNEACTIFTGLTASNRRMRFFEKDAYIFLGNFLAAQADWQKAIAAYTEAIRNEQDYDRRALGQLNIARALMASGQLFEALRVAEKMDLSRISAERIRHYFQLMRARIFLTLGFNELTLNVVGAISGPLTDPTAAVESRYLALMAQFDLADAVTFLDGWQDFLLWTEKECSEQVAAFYELEFKTYECLINPKALKNKQRYLARARHLVGKFNDKALFELLLSLTDFLFKAEKSEESFEALLVVLSKIATAHHYCMFRTTAILIAQNLLSSRHYKGLDALLTRLTIQKDEIRAGFSAKLLRDLEKERNSFDAMQAKLRDGLPENYQKSTGRIESILLG